MIIDEKTMEFIRAHREEDVRALALKAQRYPEVDMRVAVTQIEGWQAAREKLPAWAAAEGIIYPVKLSMEQCSSEATARYKASLMNGIRFADLTGGFGIDCSYLASGFEKAFYIERNEQLCTIARHNFSLLGYNHIEVVQGDSREVLATLPHCDWIFIDPARRDDCGRKVAGLAQCEPDVVQLRELLLQHADSVMIKCSPMLDITAATKELQGIDEVHVVAVGGECKELLLIMRRESTTPTLHCVNILPTSIQHFSCPLADQAVAEYTNELDAYLYEPNAAVQKGGCLRALASRLQMKMLHPNSNLLTSARVVDDFPGRRFAVMASGGFSKNEVRRLLQGIERANITVRNFPDNVATLRKKLHLADGGDDYIFATTLADGSRRLVLCKKI